MRDFRRRWSEYLVLIRVRQLDVLVALLYFGVIVPTALLGRLVGHEFLPEEGGWRRSHMPAPQAEDLRRMY